MARYDHMIDLAMSFESDNEWEDVTPDELMRALDQRVRDIRAMYVNDPKQLLEIFGLCDTQDLEVK